MSRDVVMYDLFSGEPSDLPKRWEEETKERKLLEMEIERMKEIEERERKARYIEEYKKDSKRMLGGGLFGGEYSL